MATDLTAILFALTREARPFLRRQRVTRRIKNAPCPAWWVGESVVVLCTGMGGEAAGRALDWARQAFPEIQQVVSAGFCGALVDSLHIGDLVYPNCRWRLYTVEEPCLTLAERRRIHAATGAHAVDMETAALLERGLPCEYLRVVSDDLTHPLPEELSTITYGEKLHIGRFLKAVWRRPRLLIELIQLARNTRYAAERLADALEQRWVSSWPRLPPQEME